MDLEYKEKAVAWKMRSDLRDEWIDMLLAAKDCTQYHSAQRRIRTTRVREREAWEMDNLDV